MSRDTHVADHVRWSAQRWYAGVLDADGRQADADVLLAGLESAGARETSSPRERLDGKMARVFAALITLDRAVLAVDEERAAVAVARLSGEEPGVTANLGAAARASGDLRRLYPY